MRKIAIYILLLLLPALAWAESCDTRAGNPHELRIGIGDSFWYRMLANNVSDEPVDPASLIGISAGEANELLRQKVYTYSRVQATPHFFLEYQYRLLSWLGLGAQVDVMGSKQYWSTTNGYGDYLGAGCERVVAVSVIPMARFTYLHREKINLYSSVGLGYTLLVLGSNPDNMDVFHSPAVQTTLLGLSVGSGHWFGAFELGQLTSTSYRQLYVNRLLSASVGYRF